MKPAQEESGFVAVEVGVGCQADGIAEEGEVQVGAEVEVQLSDVLTGYPRFHTGVEMEGAALRLRQPSADAEVVLLPAAAGRESSYGVWNLKRAVLVCGEDLQSRLHVFVEAFEQSDAEDVLYHTVVRLVVDGVIVQVVAVEIAVLVVVVGCEVRLVDMSVVVPFEGVDEAGDGHELVLHRRVDGVLNGLGAQEAVERRLVFDLDAGGVDGLCGEGVELCLRFGAYDAGVVRTAAGSA